MYIIRRNIGKHNWKRQSIVRIGNSIDRFKYTYVCLQCGMVAKSYSEDGFLLIEEFNTKLENVYKCPNRKKLKRTKSNKK